MIKKIIVSLICLSYLMNLFNYSYTVEAAEKPQKGNPIIVVPGITGTELFSDNEKSESNRVWPPYVGAPSPGKPPEYLDIDNDLYVGSLLGWPDSTANKGSFNVYGDLYDFLDEEGYIEYVEDQGYIGVYAFPYDWRQSNERNAEKLADYVETALVDFNKSKDDDEKATKVDIVAHSMGGILAKKYILDTDGNYVDQFVSVGTPYFGTPAPFNYLKNGFSGILEDKLREFPAVYELLPDKAYFNYNNTAYVGQRVFVRKRNGYKLDSQSAWDYKYTSDWIKKSWDEDLYMDAVSLHDDLNKQLSSYVHFYRIIGDGKLTPGFMFYDTKVHKNGKKTYAWTNFEVNGDETVALAGSAYGANNTYYFKKNHVKLIGEEEVLEAIDEILQGKNVTVSKDEDDDEIRNKPFIKGKQIKIVIYNDSNDEFTYSSVRSLSGSESFNPKIELVNNSTFAAQIRQ